MKDRSVATLLLVVGASVIAVFLLLFASASSGASDLALEQPSEMRQLEMTDEPSPTPISFASRTFGTKARHPIGSIQACQPFATIVPDQMTPSGEVTTRDNCGDDTVRTWLDDAPTGTIMIGVDPRSPFPDDWDGGSATAEIYIDVVSPTVATVMVSWPDRHGKGIHSPDSEVTATVDVDGYPLWTKRALHRSTFGDYYAVQQPPVVLTFVATRAMTHTLTFRVPPHTAWDISEITVELCPMPSLKRGYGYAPFRYCQSPNEGIFPTVDEIEADIPFLFHNSNGIRTYASCGVQGKIPELAQKYGLSVAVGVWLGPDMEVNEQEISCAITVAKQYSDVVDSVIVGNEVLLRGDLTEAQLVTYINRVKAEVDVPVTTAEIWSVLKDHPAVIDAVDYLLVHIYSWWDAWYGTTITNPAKYVVDIYKEIQQQHPGKRVVIGETGWPSGGQSQGQAIPSLENQCRFYTEFLRLAIQENVEFYYFDVFDEPWKVEEPGGVGKHWGLNYGDRTTKYKIQGVRLTESVLNLDSICSQPNRVAYLPIMLREWSGPFPTPVPPTPTPDPTPTAPAFNIYTEHGAAFNHFFPSGHMDDIEDIGMYDCWPGDPHSGETAIKVHYSAEGSRGKGLAGVYWQEPENNWGTLRGGYDLTDATALTFWARGAQGGEQVEFLVGGIWPDLCEPFRNPDSLQPAASTDVMTLTNTWQKYTMDLRGKDLSNVIGGSAWASNACLNPDGAIFYLDDIKYEYGEDTAIPAPTPTPTEPYYFDVYTDKDVAGNHYIPTGFMGDYSDITLNECWRQDVHSGSTAIRAHYTAAGSEGNNWGAVAWVHPADNWGDRPGGYDLTGADALCLWAKGERGREKIEFKIGGIGYEAGTCVTRTLDCGLEVPYPDSVCPPVYEGVFTLTDQWEEYCLTLDESVDLSHVVGGFTWAADRSRNPDGATFYLDDIRYTFNLSATPTPTPTLFYVYADDGSPANHFVPSGWMGDTGDITVNEIYQGDTCSGTTAIRISYSAQGNGPSNSCDAYGPPCWWAGVYWQEPEGNWGTVPGAGFDLSEYNELAFCARGETGGERIEFGMGGLGRDAGTCAPASPYPDSACKVSTRKTLGIEWQEYTIDLTSQDLSYIIGGFMWATSQNENPTGAVFYVDEIRFRRK